MLSDCPAQPPTDPSALSRPVDHPGYAAPTSGIAADAEVVELALLLPRADFSGLERAAGAAGVTVARLLRLLVRSHIGSTAGPSPPPSDWSGSGL